MDVNPQPSPRMKNRRPARAHIVGPTILAAVFLATLFTAWTPSSLSLGNLADQFALLMTPRPLGGEPAASTPQPPLRIGIVAGHLGFDSGAVCYDENINPTL